MTVFLNLRNSSVLMASKNPLVTSYQLVCYIVQKLIFRIRVLSESFKKSLEYSFSATLLLGVGERLTADDPTLAIKRKSQSKISV